MSMPGFNAEASLYKTSTLYYATNEYAHAHGAVYPAQIATFTPTPQLEAYHIEPFEFVGPLCKWLRCPKFYDPNTGLIQWGPCC